MATYEDGLNECKQLLLNEADGFDHAAMREGETQAGRVLAAQAEYFRHLVTQIEQREAFHAKVGGIADGDTALDGGPSEFLNLWFRLRRELETSALPAYQLQEMIAGWTDRVRETTARLNARQEG